MIRVNRPSAESVLDEKTRKALRRRQDKADALAPNSPAIDSAWSGSLRSKARDKINEDATARPPGSESSMARDHPAIVQKTGGFRTNHRASAREDS